MEEACHELDLAAADINVDHQGSSGLSFIRYSGDLVAISKLRDETQMCSHSISTLEQLSTLCTLTLPPGDPNIQLAMDEIKAQKLKLKDMVMLNPYLNL
jgi:hypothetical protein